MKLGSIDISDLKLGATQINEIRHGSTLVWQKQPDSSTLVSSYPLTETTGQAIDTVNGWNADVYGSMVRNGLSYEGNGSNAYLEVLGSGTGHIFTDANGDIPFTIRMSVNFKSITNSWLISRRAASSTACEWQIYIYNGDFVFVLMENGGSAVQMGRKLPASNLPINQFVRLAFTYDGSKNRTGVAMYMNGARIDTADFGSATYTGMAATTADTWMFAPEFNTGFRLNAFMKDVKIDKGAALTETQLQTDYQNAGI